MKLQKPHEFSKYPAKTRFGNFLCKLGLHRWKYTNYRTCKRCGRTQTLYAYISGRRDWED